MYLFTYQDIKNIDEQRRAKSMAKYHKRRMLDTANRPTPAREADVIEVVFGRYCEHEEPVGA
jgi:hypothetical protein